MWLKPNVPDPPVGTNSAGNERRLVRARWCAGGLRQTLFEFDRDPLEHTSSLNTFFKQTLAIVSPSQVGPAERQIRNTRETSLLTRKNGGLQISSVAERS